MAVVGRDRGGPARDLGPGQRVEGEAVLLTQGVGAPSEPGDGDGVGPRGGRHPEEQLRHALVERVGALLGDAYRRGRQHWAFLVATHRQHGTEERADGDARLVEHRLSKIAADRVRQHPSPSATRAPQVSMSPRWPATVPFIHQVSCWPPLPRSPPSSAAVRPRRVAHG
jgi:hypothetical protein